MIDLPLAKMTKYYEPLQFPLHFNAQFHVVDCELFDSATIFHLFGIAFSDGVCLQ